jgi:hypothetical protein
VTDAGKPLKLVDQPAYGFSVVKHND